MVLLRCHGCSVETLVGRSSTSNARSPTTRKVPRRCSSWPRRCSKWAGWKRPGPDSSRFLPRRWAPSGHPKIGSSRPRRRSSWRRSVPEHTCAWLLETSVYGPGPDARRARVQPGGGRSPAGPDGYLTSRTGFRPRWVRKSTAPEHRGVGDRPTAALGGGTSG